MNLSGPTRGRDTHPVVLTFARSDERTAYYLRTGFSF